MLQIIEKKLSNDADYRGTLLDSRLSNKLAGIELNLLIRFFVTLLPLIRVRKVVGCWSHWAVVEGGASN